MGTSIMSSSWRGEGVIKSLMTRSASARSPLKDLAQREGGGKVLKERGGGPRNGGKHSELGHGHGAKGGNEAGPSVHVVRVGVIVKVVSADIILGQIRDCEDVVLLQVHGRGQDV